MTTEEFDYKAKLLINRSKITIRIAKIGIVFLILGILIVVSGISEIINNIGCSLIIIGAIFAVIFGIRSVKDVYLSRKLLDELIKNNNPNKDKIPEGVGGGWLEIL